MELLVAVTGYWGLVIGGWPFGVGHLGLASGGWNLPRFTLGQEPLALDEAQALKFNETRAGGSPS